MIKSEKSQNFAFVLLVSAILFFGAVSELAVFAAFRMQRVAFDYMVINSQVLAAVFAALLVYAIVTRKRRTWYDFALLIAVILLSLADAFKLYINSFVSSCGPHSDKYMTDFYFICYRVKSVVIDFVNREIIFKVGQGNMYMLRMPLSVILISVFGALELLRPLTSKSNEQESD